MAGLEWVYVGDCKHVTVANGYAISVLQVDEDPTTHVAVWSIYGYNAEHEWGDQMAGTLDEVKAEAWKRSVPEGVHGS